MKTLFWLAFLSLSAFSTAGIAEDREDLCENGSLKCLTQHFKELEESDRFYAILDKASIDAAKCSSPRKMRDFLALADFEGNENTQKNLAAYMGNLCADSAPCFKKASRMLTPEQREHLEDMLEDSPSFANDSEALVHAKCMTLRPRDAK